MSLSRYKTKYEGIYILAIILHLNKWGRKRTASACVIIFKLTSVAFPMLHAYIKRKFAGDQQNSFRNIPPFLSCGCDLSSVHMTIHK